MLEEKNDNLQEADGTNFKNEENEVVDQINNENAEDSEDTSIEELRELPSITYDDLSFEHLVAHLENLLNNHKVMAIREHVESIRKAFMLQYSEFIDEKKSLFLESNPEALASDFQYDLPVKRTFDQLLNEYKSKRHSHYKTIQNQLKTNLEARNKIIEELKELVDNSDNYNNTNRNIRMHIICKIPIAPLIQSGNHYSYITTILPTVYKPPGNRSCNILIHKNDIPCLYHTDKTECPCPDT